MNAALNEPLYAKYLVRLTRAFPDFDFSFMKPVREKAAILLDLKEGNRVIDAGCGSGGSFPFLLRGVGQSGELIGIEISPSTIINTKKRIEKNNWKNIKIIAADAKNVALIGKFDGLLMFAAPDIYASEKAMSNIIPHLNEKARVVFFGAKISNRRFGWLLNGLLRYAFSKLSLPSTPTLEERPWNVIETRLESLVVEEYFFGWMFLAHGSLKSPNRA